MKMKTMSCWISALSLIALATNALAADGKQMEFKGKSQVSLSYVGTDGAQVAFCVGFGWAFGLGCMTSPHGDDTDSKYTIDKQRGIDVGSEVLVKTWGEGKVLVIYTTDKAKDCQGFRKTYVGFENAYETYSLYEVSADQTEVDPAAAKPVATLSIEGHEAHLGFLKALTATTSQKGGNSCTWGISPDTGLQFSDK